MITHQRMCQNQDFICAKENWRTEVRKPHSKSHICNNTNANTTLFVDF